MDTSEFNGMSSCVAQPRLIPHVISEHAKNTPQRIWGSLPRHPSDASQGYEDITFVRFNYAISRAATWLVKKVVPQKSRTFEALAYLGPPDSRYIIFTVAAIKVGFQMLFLSPRNSDEAQYSILDQANCQKFLCSTSTQMKVTKLVQGRPESSKMLQYVVPEETELLKAEFVPDIPYERTIEQARREPLVILHTSSTTGMPKTIPLNQGYGLHEDIVRHVPKFNDLDIITRKPFYGHCRMFVAMPLFHAGGILLTLLKSIYHDIISVFQPPSASLNSQVFDAILRYGNCNGCVIPPYLLEDMIAVPSYFDMLASLKFVQFGSGPLSKAVGDSLLTRQKNCPHYIGSSECGLFLLLELDDPIEDWQYFRFHPWSGVDMRPVNGDEKLRELFIVRSDAPSIPGLQPVFELFPDLTEWSTRDLYVQHPTKSDHWRCIGRNDDVLVLSNGEKLNPVDTEGSITNTHPFVSGVLVIGQGRFLPGLLVEVRNVDVIDPAQRAELIEEMWPSIKAANKAAPAHGQLMKSLILFTSPAKPFLRTPKLSIRRGPTINSYSKEIEGMYRRYENDIEASESDLPSAADLDSVGGIEVFLLNSVRILTGWEVLPTGEDDLFMHGVDSLHVARLTRMIRPVCTGHRSQRDISQMIYNNPTIARLSEAIFRLRNNQGDIQADTQSREENIERLIAEHSKFDLVPIALNGSTDGGELNHDTSMNIVLTGSTGSLGSYILLSLLSNPQVSHIYCLNRSEDARKRQLDTIAAQGLDASILTDSDSRVHFLHTASLGAPLLGLSDPENYTLLQRAGITHVVHNAWPVNFTFTLPSFASHLAGVRALVEFCASVPTRPEIYFLSSLSSVTALSTRTRVPESVIFDPAAPSRMGYGESKYVAERILHNATRASHGSVSTTILRIGQIAGPAKGSAAVWPVREWLPSLVVSSRGIGALPASLGRMDGVDWVPVDLLADCVVELLAAGHGRRGGRGEPGHDGQSDVYHVLNPTATSWRELLPTVGARINVERVLPLAEWIERVRVGPDDLDERTRNPARKILPFYEALVDDRRTDGGDMGGSDDAIGGREGSARYEVKKMAERSRTFRELGPVRREWMAKWTARWFEAGVVRAE